MSEVTEGKSPVPVLTEGRSPVPVLTEGKSPMPVPELPAFLDPKSEAHSTHLLCLVMTLYKERCYHNPNRSCRHVAKMNREPRAQMITKLERKGLETKCLRTVYLYKN